MHHRKYLCLFLIPLFFMMTWACAGPQKPTVGKGISEGDRVPETLAILPFENNSVTDPEKYQPLSKGLSAMLITDINQGQKALKVIERNKIAAILKEIALSQTGSVDESTAIRAGKILGAQSIAFGSFIVLGGSVRIDIRIINVETSELIMAESITGSNNAFMQLERDLAKKIANFLNVAFKPKTAATSSNIDTALYFSRGVEVIDRGDKTEAKRLFQKCIALDPSYKRQIDSIQGLQ
ncbi:MAG: hypothetical protein JRJ21_06015 [Deltaproteobacteria bacterium]|nr:hypothetical protein [Deltaproteobacteria bacterium]